LHYSHATCGSPGWLHGSAQRAIPAGRKAGSQRHSDIHDIKVSTEIDDNACQNGMEHSVTLPTTRAIFASCLLVFKVLRHAVLAGPCYDGGKREVAYRITGAFGSPRRGVVCVRDRDDSGCGKRRTGLSATVPTPKSRFSAS
jgi:hypothetical protein